MRVGMAADFIAFADDPLHDSDVVCALGSDEEESAALTLFCFRMSRIFWSPLGVGPIVEGKRKLLGVVAMC